MLSASFPLLNAQNQSPPAGRFHPARGLIFGISAPPWRHRFLPIMPSAPMAWPWLAALPETIPINCNCPSRFLRSNYQCRPTSLPAR